MLGLPFRCFERVGKVFPQLLRYSHTGEKIMPDLYKDSCFPHDGKQGQVYVSF